MIDMFFTFFAIKKMDLVERFLGPCCCVSVAVASYSKFSSAVINCSEAKDLSQTWDYMVKRCDIG